MGLPDELAALPSLDWVKTPSPVMSLPGLAKHLRLGALTVKRDDQLDALQGGNKARKLDVLLATPPFNDAPAWASLGAIGSAHLAACTAAAQALGRRVEAHLFFEPLSNGVPYPDDMPELEHLPEEMQWTRSAKFATPVEV